MRKCPYCGKEYSDEFTSCSIDRHRLEGALEISNGTEDGPLADWQWAAMVLLILGIPTAISATLELWIFWPLFGVALSFFIWSFLNRNVHWPWDGPDETPSRVGDRQ